MARPRVEEPRTKLISVRVTEIEFAIIDKKAHYSAFTMSSYLRNLGMNYRIKSRVDARAVDSLVLCKSDLAKVGGLFKMWLVANENGKRYLGSKSYSEIELIIEDLERKQDELIECARMLMHQCNDKTTRKF